MKKLPVIREVKRQVESVDCHNCSTNLAFKSVEYNDFILKRGGYLTTAAYCRMCQADATIIVHINPVKEEYLD